MRKLLLACAFAWPIIAAWPFTALADGDGTPPAGGQCLHVADIVKDIEADPSKLTEAGSKLYDFKGDDAKKFMDALNGIPPITDSLASDDVIVVVFADGSGQFAFDDPQEGGCLDPMPIPMDADMWAKLAKAAFGDAMPDPVAVSPATGS